VEISLFFLLLPHFFHVSFSNSLFLLRAYKEEIELYEQAVHIHRRQLQHLKMLVGNLTVRMSRFWERKELIFEYSGVLEEAG
jgi:hypothetical protein